MLEVNLGVQAWTGTQVFADGDAMIASLEPLDKSALTSFELASAGTIPLDLDAMAVDSEAGEKSYPLDRASSVYYQASGEAKHQYWC